MAHTDEKINSIIDTLGSLSEEVNDLKDNVNQLLIASQQILALLKMPAQPQPVASTSKPIVQGNFLSTKVTVRPLRFTKDGAVPNRAPMIQGLIALLSFEKDYPGAVDAVADILATCCLPTGFSKGLRPINWEMLNDQNKKLIISTKNSAITQLRSVAGLNPNDPTSVEQGKNLVKNVIETFSTQLVLGGKSTEFRLASLFRQSIPPQVYKQKEAGKTETSSNVSNTLIGKAWVARLPPNTREKAPYNESDPAYDTPVGLIVLEDGRRAGETQNQSSTNDS